MAVSFGVRLEAGLPSHLLSHVRSKVWPVLVLRIQPSSVHEACLVRLHGRLQYAIIHTGNNIANQIVTFFCTSRIKSFVTDSGALTFTTSSDLAGHLWLHIFVLNRCHGSLGTLHFRLDYTLPLAV